MADKDLCYLTATEAIAKFKRKTLSPVELMKAVIARCEAVNPTVNALTYTFFDRALAQARAAERRYARGVETRPLEGIPLAVKDLHPVKGEITTWGSKVYAGVRSEYTAPTVQRLFDAGAIMHARTTTPEFGHTGHGHSPLWGVTRNPWNPEYTSGGSSSGAGVTVAAGMTTLADGSDGGGSIRIPASACGVFGYKPPFGRNPQGLVPTNNWMFLHMGPLTRSVADAALMQNVMAGPCTGDITTLKPKLEIPRRLDGIRGLKVAYSPDLGYFEVDTEVARNTRAALSVFKSLGCRVKEVDVGWTHAVYDAWIVQWTGMFAAIAGGYVPSHGYLMDPYVRGLLERGLAMSAVRANQTTFVQTGMWAKLGPLLDEYDILVCPTLALPAVKAEHRCDDPDFRINGKRVHAELMWCMTYPFNLVSQCPVATVPSGFASNGVPTGLQIVGRTYDDVTVFRAAAAFESAQPWRGVTPAL
ncbi:MAG: amidase [Gammaproteobacteria bacterium]|nr:amidase [Gammaproteobacteria bacterium]